MGFRTLMIGNNSNGFNDNCLAIGSSNTSLNTTSNPGIGSLTIGYNSSGAGGQSQQVLIGANSTNSGFYSIILGSNSSTASTTSCAIGYGTSATIANQMIIGTSGETIYCPGNPITGQTPNTCLVLSSNVTLNTLLNTPPTSGQLGCQVQATIADFSNNLLTPQNFATFTSLPIGVWYITGSINLTQISTSSPSDSVLLQYSLSTTSSTQNITQYGYISSFCTVNNSFGFNYNNVIINNMSSQTYYLVILKTVTGAGLWYTPNSTASSLIASRIA
jgi:hypothetical protein